MFSPPMRLPASRRQGGFEGKESAIYWVRAATSYGRLHDASSRRRCLELAVSADATNFDTRLSFAKSCLDADDFTEAERELRWCNHRKPAHQVVNRLLEQAVRGRIASAAESKPMHEAGLGSGSTRR